MSERLIRQRGWTWNPMRLGRSLPIASGMRRARMIGLALALFGLMLVVMLVRSIAYPSLERDEAAAQELVDEILTRVPSTVADGHPGLPLWDPGGDLGQVDRPRFLVVRDAGLMREPHSSDPRFSDPALLSDAHGHFEQGQLRQAMALYTEAVLEQPGSWMARYHAGLTRARQGVWDEAREHFEQAHQLLDGRFDRLQSDPEYLARLAATRYSWGLALLREERRCEEGIKYLKDAINALKLYVRPARKARLVLVTDENDLFPVRPFALDSYQVRNALIEGYLLCQRYPEEYFRGKPWLNGFQESEYDDPAHIEILEGPFPEELATCVGETEPGGRCWALSNLNQLYFTSRYLLPFPPKTAVNLDEDLRQSAASLVQTVYNIAVLTADRPATDEIPSAESNSAVGTADEDREGRALRWTSLDYLEIAARLNEQAGDPELAERIHQFGRHLASSTSEFRLLALPYRQTPTDQLIFRSDSTPEELKGMAGALRHRFEGYLERKTPEKIPQDFETVRANLTDPKHLRSLADWQGEVESRLRKTLAEAMKLEDKRGNTQKALKLRYFQADFLGDGWSGKSFRTWMTTGRSAVCLAAVGLYLALLTLGILVHRRVIYPYLMNTTAYYQTEFKRRHAECQDANKAFTGDEVRERDERALRRAQAASR